MTERFIPREGRKMENGELLPHGTRQKQIVDHIEKILKHYVVKGSEEQIRHLALRIWRVTRRG